MGTRLWLCWVAERPVGTGPLLFYWACLGPGVYPCKRIDILMEASASEKNRRRLYFMVGFIRLDLEILSFPPPKQLTKTFFTARIM